MNWLWLAAIPLAAVAVIALWRAFSDPAFVARLGGMAVRAALKALAAIELPSAKEHFEDVWKDVTPERREQLRQEQRQRDKAERERRGNK